MSTSPGALAPLLRSELDKADAFDVAAKQFLLSAGPTIDTPSTGRTVSSAYEHLRNAAEYAEEHLLLQRAIKRFYVRNLFVLRRDPADIGNELLSELILAGYLENGRVSEGVAREITVRTQQYLSAHTVLASGHKDAAKDWVLACLSSEIEMLLRPHFRYRAVLATAFQYFLSAIPRTDFAHYKESANYELCLYIAIHEALLKSDIDALRYDVCDLYQVTPQNPQLFASTNTHVDQLAGCELTSRLKRVVRREGAPLRVLKGMAQTRPDMATLLANPADFMTAYRDQTAYEYAQVQKRLDVGLRKSIVFLIITKMLIGAAIEVPFDLWKHGRIIWLPLVINLLFPPVYLALLRLGVRPPTARNAELLAVRTEQILFTGQWSRVAVPPRLAITPLRQILYTVVFSVPVALMFAALYALHFNILQMAIFLVFFSTASSLALRLHSQVRELELERRSSGLLASIIDFLTLPFVAVGQWLGSKYRQLNLVARVLDVVIEMPLKTIIRLVQQWIRFFDEQRDRLS